MNSRTAHTRLSAGSARVRNAPTLGHSKCAWPAWPNVHLLFHLSVLMKSGGLCREPLAACTQMVKYCVKEIFFFLRRVKEEEKKGQERKKRRGRRKRRSGRCSWPPEAPKRQGAPGRRRSASQPKRVSRLKHQIPRGEAKRKEKPKDETEKTGGRKEQERRKDTHERRTLCLEWP